VRGASRVDEAGGLATVDDLGDLAVEEGILDVELASPSFKGKRDREDDADRGQFDNRTQRLVEVKALLLRETAKHPTCFIAVERTIGLQLVVKDPLAEDNVGVPRRRHEIPSVVAEESMILLGHNLKPVEILERRTYGEGNWRVPVDRRNRKIRKVIRTKPVIIHRSSRLQKN
jgi:hypothetical protein